MARREIGIKKRGTSRRKLKPVYLIIAEGKNKTEVLFYHISRIRKKVTVFVL